MGESESFYGGLDCSTVYTAKSVLQLQELLQRKNIYGYVPVVKNRTHAYLYMHAENMCNKIFKCKRQSGACLIRYNKTSASSSKKEPLYNGILFK